ncbi:MAG TPA: nucleotidyltransferase family protein [Thermoanaerobaculia bacterium]|nr:nucleotidyltransferase family protein [Thermoanaerobaculia bacterium]
MAMREEIPSATIPREQIAALCVRHGIQELALFGSFLTDRFQASSDVDLLVTFKPETRPGFLTLARVQRDLEALFGRPVDLVPKGGLKPAIRDAVLAESRVLYAA